MSHNENESLGLAEVLTRIKTIPEVVDNARIVGRWVWVEFDAMPKAETREFLKGTGFHWNRARKARQPVRRLSPEVSAAEDHCRARMNADAAEMILRVESLETSLESYRQYYASAEDSIKRLEAANAELKRENAALQTKLDEAWETFDRFTKKRA
jgi:hypothetical protein